MIGLRRFLLVHLKGAGYSRKEETVAPLQSNHAGQSARSVFSGSSRAGCSAAYDAQRALPGIGARQPSVLSVRSSYDA